MRARSFCPLALTMSALAVAACSRDSATAAAKPDASTATSPAARRAVCAMVTAAEMSGILGATVSSEGEEGGGSTTCRYTQAERTTSLVELTVDWGGGHAAMTGVAILGKREPGISDPLAGLGDEASSIGPALWVRVGDDLVNLTIWGVDEEIAVAKRIIDLMRPRMGASAQATGNDKASRAHAREDAAKTGAIVSGLLDRLSGANDRPPTSEKDNEGTAPPRVEEPTFRSAAGLPRRRIPLVKGLTMVLARHEPRRGDWEGIGTIDEVSPAEVSMTYRADPPDIGPLVIARVVRRVDLKESHRLHGRFTPGDPVEFSGSTALSFSTAVLDEIKTRGETMFEWHSSGERAMLTRVESGPVAFPVLVNNEAVEVPAIHVRDTVGGSRHYYMLDDPDNALMLRASNGVDSSQMVRIAFPVESEPAAIEERLKKEGRVDVYGIYFDFAKSTLRPESERVLDEIAIVLKNNPMWKLKVDGHTDNIGGDAYNRDLSRQRSAAVKAALVERYRIASDRLTTDGLGASHPKATNDTLSGRALNRRVELVRQ